MFLYITFVFHWYFPLIQGYFELFSQIVLPGYALRPSSRM